MMYKTEGIIIKTANLGEFDRLITVYTRDFGKLILKGKAVRKNQAKLRAHLDLFLHSYLMLAPARGYDIIAGAETIQRFVYLQSDLERLTVAYYLSELFDRLVPAPEKDENLWQLLKAGFNNLNNQRLPAKRQIQELEKGLIYCLGYGTEQKNARSLIKELVGDELASFGFYKKLLF